MRTIDHGQETGQLYHLQLQVECTLFVIYKAGSEPTTVTEQSRNDGLHIKMPIGDEELRVMESDH
jgi:hypothetical protein